uniref:25S rRNA (uridine-N(3))-methyltransferase BMT5-like domain-containing protein n=1 Tax=Mucochytrium quahogii TaxID=96639 RepID=A0A7S2WKD2_9STRA|mmetsp:Transcript_14145/g.23117  ORF Transcript_14145/g.23117 Transcript_14145/m.23117 type:complete len:326 (+) Transcript_14145:37-1014(+)|eukprot:CAMPEP_0203749902 /NCGR_PEP_ID=MMETSP0098-20131031/4270_1 /ASSEMBLY_ACC=CAM_ASM_000208 /TAXON_ID=96639 /ORGANISM=" , Strain NY0313808BC1" /LENGTH=325 /DNA_ID=CAMNT_0050639021 /DNA_START=37 /DNA_END=1014 /DNA_ORIENTATION=+
MSRGRPTAKNRKKPKLSKRRTELVKANANRKKHQYKHAEKSKKVNEKVKTQESKKLVGMLTPQHKTLLVGEGNFSFTRALMRLWENEQRARLSTKGQNKVDVEDLVGFNVVATCLDTKEELVEKYPDVKDCVREIKASGGTVLCGIDGTQLIESKRLLRALEELSPETIEEEGSDVEEEIGFDRIVFNFPHLGCGIQDTERNNLEHRKMLERFFISAHSVLNNDGQLHVTVKVGEPYDSWRVPQIAIKTGLYAVHSSIPFDPSRFDGYVHRRTLGAPDKDLQANADIHSEKTKSRTLVFVKADYKSKKKSKAKKKNDDSDSDEEM